MPNRKKVLLVDDDSLFCSVIQKVLSVYHEIQIAHFVSSAKEKLKQNEFDFIILDYHLENENGLDLIPLIKAYSPRSVILLLSGSDDFGVVAKALSMGVDEYLVKSEDVHVHLLVRIPFLFKQKQKSIELESYRLRPNLRLPQSPDELSPEHYKEFLENAEALYLNAATELNSGDLALTAERIGLARSTIFRKESIYQFRKFETS